MVQKLEVRLTNGRGVAVRKRANVRALRRLRSPRVAKSSGRQLIAVGEVLGGECRKKRKSFFFFCSLVKDVAQLARLLTLYLYCSCCSELTKSDN